MKILEDKYNDQDKEKIEDQPVEKADAEPLASCSLGPLILQRNDPDWLPVKIHRAVSSMSCGEKRDSLPLFRVHGYLGVAGYVGIGWSGHCDLNGGEQRLKKYAPGKQ